MDIDFNAFLKNYGPMTALVLYFVYKDLWPWLRDKLYPDITDSFKSERRYQRRTEDRLFTLAEQNITVMTQLQKTIELIGDTCVPALQSFPSLATGVARLLVLMTALSQDMAGLYGERHSTPPSRVVPDPTVEIEK